LELPEQFSYYGYDGGALDYDFAPYLLCEIDSESLDVGGAFHEGFSIALSLLDLAS